MEKLIKFFRVGRKIAMLAKESRLNDIMETYERDREYIALELHDNVSQKLASSLHHIQAATQSEMPPDERRQNLFKALHLIRQSVDAVRGLMGELKPPALDFLCLAETLRYDIIQFQKETGWLVQFEADGANIPQEIELPLYRILREAITNVKRHAQSDSIIVRLHNNASEIVAEVKDKGKGFKPFKIYHGGLGLLSMRTRAKALGGECLIHSIVGQGTTVQVRLPLERIS